MSAGGMTVAVADHPAVQPISAFTGTTKRLRLALRRDRIIAPLWVALLGFVLPITYVTSVPEVYPTEADRVRFAAATSASPAQIAMYGPIFDSSPGAVTIWKAGALFTMVGIAVILTVVRHTRVEEELGRAELIESTAVGRCSGTAAALLLACGCSVLVGVLSAAALLSGGLPVGGSLGFGAALAGSGLVFTGIACVAAQLSISARMARGIAFAVVAVTFACRGVGDAASGALGALSWLAPQGWSVQLRPFADERWWVLALHPMAAAVLIVVAFALLRHRDLGAGLVAERPGEPRASRALSGPIGLAWRLQRGTMLAWTVGLGTYALLIGSVAKGIGNEIGDSPVITGIVERAGGPASLELSLIGFGFTALGIAAAAYSISAVLRLQAEEAAAGRGELVLAGSVGRIRWAFSHIGFAMLGPGIALGIGGFAAGSAYGIATDDMSNLPAILGAALVQLPAVWLPTGVAVAMWGALPRYAAGAWAVLIAFALLVVVGSAAGLPQALLDLEPFGHLPTLPGGDFVVTPILWLLALDAAAIAFGLAAFRRRDLA